MTFEDPVWISAGETNDEIWIKFDGSQFEGLQTKQTVETSKIVKKKLPRQLENTGFAKLLEAITEPIGAVNTGVTASSFALNFLFNMSLA